jgi:hypothetical protein
MYTNSNNEVPLYAVFRNGVRVSESEYDSKAVPKQNTPIGPGLLTDFPTVPSWTSSVLINTDDKIYDWIKTKNTVGNFRGGS